MCTNNPGTKKFIKLFWIIFCSILGSIALLITLTYFEVFGKLPSFIELENPKSNIASEVISSDGHNLGTYYTEYRSMAEAKEISHNVINALIATEDIRFYSHSGIDFYRMLSIFYFNLIGKKQGASTITQQLALNLFDKREKDFIKRLIQKIKESIIAIQLEKRYTKETIAAMYLNTVFFGSSAFGIKAAAKTFFNTTPDKLTINQSAILIGALKGVTLYSPIRNPQRAIIRRNVVLKQMVKANLLSKAQYVAYAAEDLNLDYHPINNVDGLAPYFREVLKKEIVDMINDGTIAKKADGSTYNIYKDGLKIYTTINSTLQKKAEEAIAENLKSLQEDFFKYWQDKNQYPWTNIPGYIDKAIETSLAYKELASEGLSKTEIYLKLNEPVLTTLFSWDGPKEVEISPIDSIKYYKMILRSAMMSMNPHNGHVLAWVGGPDFKYFKYDQVKQGKRQIGSTFKPFVYVTAIDNGFSPCQKIPNEPVTFEDQPDYHPQNAGGKSGGYMTILEGLARSVNLITINLTHQLGPKSIVETAHKMGISSYLPAVPSIGLGVADISLYEMVGAYSTFANKGIWIKPIYLTKIEDANGNIIYSNKPVVRQAISEQTAYVMLKMMEEATNRGTAIRLRRPQAPYNIPYPIASKTGTTNDQSDGWYIGITPDLVTGVWTGGEDRIIRFYSLALGGGTNSALPAWSIYMNKVYKDEDYKVSTEDFLAPDNLSIELDCEKYAQFTGTPESEENISNTPGNPNNLNEERDKNIYDNNYHDNINNIKDIYKGDNVDDGHDLNF